MKTDPELVILPDGNDKNYILHIKLDTEGCFNAVVRYNKLSLSQGQFTIISLNGKFFTIPNAHFRCRILYILYIPEFIPF